MPIVLANQSKANLLSQKIGYLNYLFLHLFANPVTITGDTTETAFVQPNDGGYSKTGYQLNFGAPYLNAAKKGETDSPAIRWDFVFDQGPFTVYGYYVVESSTNHLVYSESFATPFPVSAAGASLTVQPVMLEDTM